MSVLKGKPNVDHSPVITAQAQNIMKTTVDQDLNYKMMLIMAKMNDETELKINKDSPLHSTQLLPTSQQDDLDFISPSNSSFTNPAVTSNATAAVHQKVVLNNAPSMISNSNSSHSVIAGATFAVAEQSTGNNNNNNNNNINTESNACSNFEPHYWRFVCFFCTLF